MAPDVLILLTWRCHLVEAIDIITDGGFFMKIPTYTIIKFLSLFALIPAFISCTLTNGSSDFTSSTTPDSLFTGDGLVKHEKKVIAFTQANFANLRQDMAEGQGEYLASLGTLFGIQQAHQAAFFAFAQENYSQLMNSDRTTPDEMLAILTREWSANPSRQGLL